MLTRKIISTDDGSSTIFIPEWNESYHSKHGAVQEAYHVFIRNGLELLSNKKEISILEIGFGTGLNALITLLESHNSKQIIHYTALEKYPVAEGEHRLLNYPSAILDFYPTLPFVENEIQNQYSKLINSDWEEFQTLSSTFNLRKIQSDFLDFNYPKETFDLIYFDAFGARVQPELWTKELFQKIYDSMKKDSVFTTYSSKGSVRRALMKVGFNVEKHPGPPGKREMLIAKK